MCIRIKREIGSIKQLKDNMKGKITKSKLFGTIAVPGSKSHTIRAIAVAMMANGKSILHYPLISDDTISCLNAASNLGAKVNKKDNQWEIDGVNNNLINPNKIIDLGNSGTSLRILTGLASLADFPITFDGDESLRTRLMSQLLDPLADLKVDIISDNAKCPITITGTATGGEITVDGTSSQFLTSLLFATPLMQTDSLIKVKNLNEKPYVEITLDWLDKQNIKLEYNKDLTEFKVKGNQNYTPFDLAIPADFSTATFPLIAAAVTGGDIEILNLDFSDKQGDKLVFDILKEMGLNIKKTGNSTYVKSTGKLKGMHIDLNSIPDALPAMSIVASIAEGTTYLENVPQARYKETDRIKCMTCELRKMGIKITELEDGMIIEGGSLQGTEVESYDDHRIAMSLAIAGCAAKGTTIVNNIEAAAVTYPNFINDLKKLGMQI